MSDNNNTEPVADASPIETSSSGSASPEGDQDGVRILYIVGYNSNYSLNCGILFFQSMNRIFRIFKCAT